MNLKTILKTAMISFTLLIAFLGVELYTQITQTQTTKNPIAHSSKHTRKVIEKIVKQNKEAKGVQQQKQEENKGEVQQEVQQQQEVKQPEIQNVAQEVIQPKHVGFAVKSIFAKGNGFYDYCSGSVLSQNGDSILYLTNKHCSNNDKDRPNNNEDFKMSRLSYDNEDINIESSKLLASVVKNGQNKSNIKDLAIYQIIVKNVIFDKVQLAAESNGDYFVNNPGDITLIGYPSHMREQLTVSTWNQSEQLSDINDSNKLGGMKNPSKISGGSSGSPLLNSKGEMIGVLVARDNNNAYFVNLSTVYDLIRVIAR